MEAKPLRSDCRSIFASQVVPPRVHPTGILSKQYPLHRYGQSCHYDCVEIDQMNSDRMTYCCQFDQASSNLSRVVFLIISGISF
jgi:hypothetical protein